MKYRPDKKFIQHSKNVEQGTHLVQHVDRFSKLRTNTVVLNWCRLAPYKAAPSTDWMKEQNRKHTTHH